MQRRFRPPVVHGTRRDSQAAGTRDGAGCGPPPPGPLRPPRSASAPGTADRSGDPPRRFAEAAGPRHGALVAWTCLPVPRPPALRGIPRSRANRPQPLRLLPAAPRADGRAAVTGWRTRRSSAPGADRDPGSASYPTHFIGVRARVSFPRRKPVKWVGYRTSCTNAQGLAVCGPTASLPWGESGPGCCTSARALARTPASTMPARVEAMTDAARRILNDVLHLP